MNDIQLFIWHCLTSDNDMIYFICKANYTIWWDNMKTKIHELRKQNKVTQEELANAVNVTRQTIISIENEKYTASLALAYKISHYFGLTIEDVFDFSGIEEN